MLAGSYLHFSVKTGNTGEVLVFSKLRPTHSCPKVRLLCTFVNHFVTASVTCLIRVLKQAFVPTAGSKQT